MVLYINDEQPTLKVALFVYMTIKTGITPIGMLFVYPGPLLLERFDAANKVSLLALVSLYDIQEIKANTFLLL